jgi:cystathionine beta-lyase
VTAYDFDRIVDRRGTDSDKWDKYKDKPILPLWVADMDFSSPPAVLEALHQRVDHGVFGYSRAPQALVETVLAMLAEQYDWHVEPSWLIWLPGLVSGLNVSCRAVGERGDDILTAIPVYPPFLTAPRNSERNLVTVPLVQDGAQWGFDFDQLAAAITPATRLFILCNPHNPVGRVFTREELTQLAQLCLQRGIVICADEIHCGLILDGDKRHLPMATLDPQVAEMTITLMAPSKTYNLPGLGCSFAVIPNPKLRQPFKTAMRGIVPHVNLMGYTAALAAYRGGQAWHEQLLAYLRDNRDQVERQIAQMPGLSMAHVEATYLAWIDTRPLGLEQPLAFFEAAGVGLSNGTEFGTEGFMRLNFGCPQKTLTEALRRMRQALAHTGSPLAGKDR